MRACLLLAWALCARLAGGSSLQVAILMQGSDFIDVNQVPTMGVSQLDLGDVYLSPCRAGSFSADHGGVCHECNVCGEEEYQTADCLTYQDRACGNCTACTERQVEICPCGNTTDACYIGNRVCQPLASMTVTLSFNVYADKALTVLQQRFLEQGLATGFVVYLGSLLQQPLENIQIQPVVPQSRSVFRVTYVLTDVYRLDALATLGSWSDRLIQSGLAVTFGQGSNTFATRRRLLASAPFLMGNGSGISCMPETTCGQFFSTVLTVSGSCTVATCTALPCPAGYTGDFGLCTPCPNATYKAVNGSDACTACPAGFTSNMMATSQGQCRLLVVPTTTSARATTSQASSSRQAGTSAGQPAPAFTSTGQLAWTSTGQPGLALTSTGQPGLALTSTGPAPPALTSQGPPAPGTTSAEQAPPPPAPPPSGWTYPAQAGGGTYIVTHNERSVVINYQESDPWAIALMGTVFLCGSALILVLWAHLHPEGGQYTLLPQGPRRVIPRAIVPQAL